MASTVGDVGAAAGAGAAGGSSSSGGGGGGVPTIAQYATQAAAASDSKSVAEVVNAAINDPHIFVFGELLAVAKVQALAGTAFEKVVDALKTFAYGTIDDVKGKGIVVAGPALHKLKQLTVVSMAGSTKTLSYASLQKRLELDNVRDLEDLVISCITAGLVRATLNQRAAQVRVLSTAARDVGPGDLDAMIAKLTAWKEQCVTTAARANAAAGAVAAELIDDQQRAARLEQRAAVVRREVLASMGTAQGGDAVAGGFDQGADWRAGYMPDEPHTRGRPKRRHHSLATDGPRH